MSTIGRLAPSPTGAQHLGNARTYLFAWLLCRQQPNNSLHLRIEDLETPRVKLWAVDQIFADFAWLGLTWDPIDESTNQIFQSQRIDRYRQILQKLLDAETVYPCTCSRSDIQTASAPHESILDGQIYSGKCKSNQSSDCKRLDAKGIQYSLRFRTQSKVMNWRDRFYGDQALNVAAELGDFVVWRNDNQPAYQLAVVVDDHDMGISQVVRGADLIYSTFRQIEIYNAMRWDVPEFIHLPLVVGTDGRRLAKRHGDTRLSTLREHGVQAEQLIGYLAWRSGLIDKPRRIQVHELLCIELLDCLLKTSMVFDTDTELSKLLTIE